MCTRHTGFFTRVRVETASRSALMVGGPPVVLPTHKDAGSIYSYYSNLRRTGLDLPPPLFSGSCFPN